MKATDQKKGILIAVLAQDADSLPALHRLVNNPGVKFSCYSSLHHLKKSRDSLGMCSGVILDLQTIISASTEEKDFLRELKKDSKIPTLEIAVPTDATDPEQLPPLEARLKSFIPRCFDFSAETNLREHPRKPLIMKVKIKPSTDESAPVVKAVTSDLSEGGCFVVSFGDWSQLKELYLEFNDSGILIPCQVVWDRKWEQAHRRFPGFGAKFAKLDDKVKAELTKLLDEES